MEREEFARNQRYFAAFSGATSRFVRAMVGAGKNHEKPKNQVTGQGLAVFVDSRLRSSETKNDETRIMFFFGFKTVMNSRLVEHSLGTTAQHLTRRSSGLAFLSHFLLKNNKKSAKKASRSTRR